MASKGFSQRAFSCFLVGWCVPSFRSDSGSMMTRRLPLLRLIYQYSHGWLVGWLVGTAAERLVLGIEARKPALVATSHGAIWFA